MEWHPSGDTEIIAIMGGVNKLRPNIHSSFSFITRQTRQTYDPHFLSRNWLGIARVLGTSPTICLWSRITSDLGKMTTDKNWVKKKEYFFVFLEFQAICKQTHKLNIRSDENVKWLFQEWNAAEFCISCRRSLRNSDNWNGNEQGSFDNHLDFLLALIPRRWKEVSS